MDMIISEIANVGLTILFVVIALVIVNYLRENNINLLQKSSFYESVSYPNKNDPKFINVDGAQSS